MNTAAIAYTFVGIAFLILVAYGPSPGGNKHHQRHGRRLRLNTHNHSNHSRVSFDPIVADLEQHRQDREREHQYIQQHHPQLLHNSSSSSSSFSPDTDRYHDEWDAETEDYLNDEERFNITQRLVVLFPLVDVKPHDGFISVAELEEWHVGIAVNKMWHHTDRELQSLDANRDGGITLKEYLSHMTDEELASNSTEHGEAGWWKEQFDCADEDGDGALNHTELYNFLHPEDSKNVKLREWMCKEKIKERDEDKDGKLNFAEFDHGAYALIRQYDEVEPNSGHGVENVPSSKERFAELDKNNDGFLTENELGPILHKLHPGEISYARYQSRYLMDQADENKDGKLTLEEMLANPYAFYNTAYGDEDEEDYDDYTRDEFR